MADEHAPPGIFGYTCLGVSVTLACPLECAHCITNSSPRVRDEMSLGEALGYVRDADHVIDHISVTGGEPFLKFPRLAEIVKQAKSQKYIVFVMTSGYWGRNKARAAALLRQLRDHGLDMVGISLDRFHLRFVDERRCVNICEICDDLGLRTAVRVIAAKDDDYGDHVKRILAHTRAEVHVNYLVRLGRASELADSAFNTCRHPPRETCETVTAADVVPGGVVYACCGPGLYMTESNPLVLGNAREERLSHILARGLANPFMKTINVRGPVGLLEDLQAHGLGHLVKTRARYTDACQLCLDICNSPAAVAALQAIYADPDRRRTQNASQFLKMVGDYKLMNKNRVGRPFDRAHG